MGVDLSDAELMRRVRDGEVGRLGLLFERHHRRLYNFFLRSTGERGASEDLVQEVFVRMLKYGRSFRDEGDFLPWMYTLARNAAADGYRRSARHPTAPEPLLERASAEPLASEVLEAGERERRVRRALGLLAPERREVLLLSKFEQLRYDQIAATLGCSVGAVKVRVHRALKELAELLRRDGEETLA
jgi:RNA polymerase sigma-70 factor, ECF subfamily